MIVEGFQHRHAAHCETGAMSSLLHHYGFEISEPMVFGLASGLIFIHMPWVKVGGLPLTAYRMWPRAIISGLQGNLKMKMAMERFSNQQQGMAALDCHLAAGRPVGLQTSIYWLSYFPPEMRFHFNAHNMVVYGKEGDEYLVSDPVFDYPVRCPAHELQKSRFTKGLFAPRGALYYPLTLPSGWNFEKALKHAIRKTTFQMLHVPLPFLGVRGIHTMAKQIRKLAKESDPRYARLFLGNIVRMQEEIGTGGAGFRFMYASFLQEAAEKSGWSGLAEASQQMTAAGDNWREFALHSANFVRKKPSMELAEIADRLDAIAGQEREVYRVLEKVG